MSANESLTVYCIAESREMLDALCYSYETFAVVKTVSRDTRNLLVEYARL